MSMVSSNNKRRSSPIVSVVRNNLALHFTTPFLLSVSNDLSDQGASRSTYSRQNIALSSAPETSRPSLSTSSLAIGPNSRCMSFGSSIPNSLSSKYATPPLPDCELTRMTSRYSRPMSAGSIVRYGTSQKASVTSIVIGGTLYGG